MNIAWVENAALRVPECGGRLFEEFCIYAFWILSTLISWKGHLYYCA
jgi:hypothetical protein